MYGIFTYVYLHLVDFYGKLVGKYTTWMVWVTKSRAVLYSETIMIRRQLNLRGPPKVIRMVRRVVSDER